MKGLGGRCLTGSSDVLYIVPIFKKSIQLVGLSLRHGVEFTSSKHSTLAVALQFKTNTEIKRFCCF